MPSRPVPVIQPGIGTLLVLAVALLAEACEVGLPMIAATVGGRGRSATVEVEAELEEPLRDPGPVRQASLP